MAPDIVKPVPLSRPELMVTAAVPVDVNVTGSVDGVLSARLPNATLAGLMANVGTEAVNCREKFLATLPPVAVRITDCAEVTGDTLAMNVALIAFAGTRIVPGTATAALLLARLTLKPPLGAAAFSVTVQALLPDPPMDAVLQLNPLKAAAETAALTGSVRLAGVLCSALGFTTPMLTVVVPWERAVVLRSSVGETKMVVTSVPETSSCDAETKPVPCISNRKLTPGAACVTEPEVRLGSGLRILTVIEAEEGGVSSVVALIVTEWPAQILEGEYTPEADIGPVELGPPTTPLTDHTTSVAMAPLMSARYCVSLPSLACAGPRRETWGGVCA